MRVLTLALLFTLAASVALAAEAPAPPTARTVTGRQQVGLTIYNQGFALVKDQRRLHLDRGLNWLRFEDVAAEIDPTTVAFRSLTAPQSVSVREQNYQYDLITPANILQKSIGERVRVRRFLENGESRVIEGTLLSSPQGGLVIQVDDGVVLSPSGQIEVPTLPPGLITRPALLWQLQASRAGDHTGEISYLTGGVSWESDYVARVHPDDARVDLTGWVTLRNTSGVDYPDAEVRVVAGDVRRLAASPGSPRPPGYPPSYGGSAGYAGPGPTRTTPGEEGLFEYHLY
ncbi:MAG: hypothetical protein HY321_07995, partial [Armatimonadetes bacterium]|nr:hypothetical protein [Armatimonadota bacterium]